MKRNPNQDIQNQLNTASEDYNPSSQKVREELRNVEFFRKSLINFRDSVAKISEFTGPSKWHPADVLNWLSYEQMDMGSELSSEDVRELEPIVQEIHVLAIKQYSVYLREKVRIYCVLTGGGEKQDELAKGLEDDFKSARELISSTKELDEGDKKDLLLNIEFIESEFEEAVKEPAYARFMFDYEKAAAKVHEREFDEAGTLIDQLEIALRDIYDLDTRDELAYHVDELKRMLDRAA